MDSVRFFSYPFKIPYNLNSRFDLFCSHFLSFSVVVFLILLVISAWFCYANIFLVFFLFLNRMLAQTNNNRRKKSTGLRKISLEIQFDNLNNLKQVWLSIKLKIDRERKKTKSNKSREMWPLYFDHFQSVDAIF